MIDDGEDIEAIGEKAGRYTRAVLDETETVSDAALRLLDSVRAEPLKAASIALGIGLVFGFLMRGRD